VEKGEGWKQTKGVFVRTSFPFLALEGKMRREKGEHLHFPLPFSLLIFLSVWLT
jgi:hypothetical protein